MPNRVQTASAVLDRAAQSMMLVLIHQYQSAASKAVDGLKASTKARDLLTEWRAGRIAQRGQLQNPKGWYQFHGVGCRFETGGLIVDVDFGPEGRHDGFDGWRLWQFSQSQPGGKKL